MKKWFKYQTEPITESKGTSILWDFALQTDKKIKSKRLDKVVK